MWFVELSHPAQESNAGRIGGVPAGAPRAPGTPMTSVAFLRMRLALLLLCAVFLLQVFWAPPQVGWY
jgi:hypothetical protein